MIKLNTPYTVDKIEKVIFSKDANGNIIGTYNDGTLQGALEGNVLKATFKNTKVNVTGLMELTFHNSGFEGKWKKGTEPGPMKGKWNGYLESKSEQNLQKSEENEIVIELSGRIAKYFFGSVKEDFQEELKGVLEYCSDEISTEEDFLRMLLKMTLEDRETAREDFFCYIEESDLEDNFPNLHRLIMDMEEYSYDHHALYDELFDTAEYWDGGTGYVSFFESDANIRILINDEEKVKKQNLSSFFKSVEKGNTEEGPTNKNVELFIERNIETWGLSESLSFSKNQQGCFLIEDWFTPSSLIDLSELDNNVTILHDDIITYSFTIYTDEFKFEDLLFLGFSNYSDFRNSSEDNIFNYLFYKNEIVTPDESWERDKGITLNFKPKKERLDFLLNG